MSIVSPITIPQPQLAQLEVKFAGPLVIGSIVESITDLLTLNYNYQHKIVWVKEEAANFYLKTGDGTISTNWEKIGSRVVMERYNPESSYSKGTTVYLGNKIYNAQIDVPVGYSPLDYPDYWLIISGETETKRFIFKNKSSIIVYTDIRNPKFEIILGDLVYDENGIIVIGADGLAKLENKEIVEAYIKQREDLDNSNGIPYEIIFEEDSNESIQVSGCINIK